MVCWEIAANTPHATYSTPEGRAAIWATPSMPGDFNNNGKVDAADYVIWRKTIGRPDCGAASANDLVFIDTTGTRTRHEWVRKGEHDFQSA